MLLNNFKVSGFKVFGKPVEINLIPKVKNYRALEDNIIVGSKNNKNLKSTIIYGGNNTGKSSLLDAFLAFKRIVTKGTLDNFPFDLMKNFCYGAEDIVFEVTFSDGEDNITYGIEFNESREIGEYVFKDDELFFSRERDNTLEGLLINNAKIKERIEDLPLDKLVLTFMNEYVVKNEVDVFLKIKDFFNKIEYVNDQNKNMIMSKKILDFVGDEKKMKILNGLIESTELYIEKREFADENYVVNNEYYNKHMSKDSIDRLKNVKSQIDGLRMVSYYKDSKNNSVPKPSVLFDSIGTNKFIVLSMYIIDALLNEKILLIDEIDSSLHYKLTRALVILMNSEANLKSQFIMTTHDVKLLSPKLLRKDQVNFIVRDKDAITIVALDDFKANTTKDVRSSSNFEKMYVEERIVDLPDTNISIVIKEMQKIWGDKIKG